MSQRTGTREWAETGINVCVGCAHGCLYCYAADMAHRFKWMPRLAWSDQERPDREDVERLEGKRFTGRVMFPTRHDWTPTSEPYCAVALGYLLAAGNDVLVVTKGGQRTVDLVRLVVVELNTPPAMLPEIRFSITHWSERVGRFWEPRAPSVDARLCGLGMASCAGYPTSVSMEPLLQPEKAVEMVAMLAPLCRRDDHGRGGEIWIGKARHLARRTAWARGRVAGLQEAVEQLEDAQSDDGVMLVYEALQDHPQVRWKDSYAEVIRRCCGD